MILYVYVSAGDRRCDVTPVPVCFLQKDLIHTIGESAALGAAGFVIWGDLNLTSSRVGVLRPLTGKNDQSVT